jgi:hypothetical protein
MPEVVPILGTILAVGLNLSPCILFYEYFKGKRTLDTIPEMMFVIGVFCCTTNLAYGLLKDDINLYLNSAICEVIQITYATIYLFLYAEKDFTKWFLYVFIAFDLTLEILYIFYDVIAYHTSHSFGENFTGWFNVFMTVCNAAAPGQKIIDVWKSENFMLIPIYTTLAQISCSALWGFYGFSDMDLKLILPNLLGVALCAIQIFSYYYFYLKRHGKPPETDDKEKEETIDEEVPSDAKDKLIGNDSKGEANESASTEGDAQKTI